MGHSAKKGGKPADIIDFPSGESEAETDRSPAETTDSDTNSPSIASRIEPEALAEALKIWSDDTGSRPGERLKAMRETLGVTIADIASETFNNKLHLEAIESMYVSNLPAGMLTPMLRTYCNVLNFPADTIIHDYTAECGAVETVEKAAIPVKPSGPSIKINTNGRAIAMVAATASVALIGLIWGVNSFTGAAPASETPGLMASLPAVNGANESLFSDAEPLVAGSDIALMPLSLTAVSQGWIEVRGADGTIFRSRMMSAGESYHPRLGAGWTVSARDGGAFEWRVGEVVIGLLGTESAPVYAVSIDAVANEIARTLTPEMAGTIEGQPTR